MEFLNKCYNNLKGKNLKVVLPEGEDERMIKAARQLVDDNLAAPILMGNIDKMKGKAAELSINIDDIELVEPEKDSKYEEYCGKYFEMRKHKGLSEEDAADVMKDPLFFGAMMVKDNRAETSVAGAVNSTGNVLKAAFQIVGLKPGVRTVSSAFIMVLPEFRGEKDKILIFADCAVIPDPESKTLASIAEGSAELCRKIVGIEPKVAMLSFSTKGSATHNKVEKIQRAVEILRESNVDFDFDGELQLDAAIIPEIGAKKAPGSEVAGKANVLVFPDLNAANIGYKLVQRLAGAEAIGPIMQGLNKPVNDLSRGASVADIYNVVVLSLSMV